MPGVSGIANQKEREKTLIAQVYVIACDDCRKNMQILQGAHSIGGAFKQAKKLPWRRNNNNTKHVCPECMAKVRKEVKPVAEGCEVEAGNVAKEVKPT
jgi:predicted nucleic acid-binding Zn ribbon protein